MVVLILVLGERRWLRSFCANDDDPAIIFSAAVGVVDRDRFIGDTRIVPESDDEGVVPVVAMRLLSLSLAEGGGVFIKSLFALRETAE